MTDESPSPGSDDDAWRALGAWRLAALETAEPGTIGATSDDLADAAPNVLLDIYNSIPAEAVTALMVAGVVYAKAFLETLAKRNADTVAEAIEARIRKKGKTREMVIGLEDGSAAEVIVTSDLPVEARLALLDLDVTADELRGKTLQWDDATKAWRADSADD